MEKSNSQFEKSLSKIFISLSSSEFVGHHDNKNFKLSWYFSWFSGSMRDIGFLGVEHWRLMFSTPENPFFRSQSKKKLERNFNEVQMKKKYRIHNIYVKESFKKLFSKIIFVAFREIFPILKSQKGSSSREAAVSI